MDKNFGKALYELRKKHKKTQQQLADALGIAKGNISKYESGEQYPEFPRLKKIADFFGVSASFLVSSETDLIRGIPETGVYSSNFSENKKESHVILDGAIMRVVTVNYTCQLCPREFKAASDVSSMGKTVQAPSSLVSNAAFAVMYSGAALGEILEHGQVLVLEKKELVPGDLCLLKSETGFLLSVFESKTAFGHVFRAKGMPKKLEISETDKTEAFQVVLIMNNSSIS